MKTILITGSKGQLGIALREYYQDKKEYQLICTDIDEIDISNYENTHKVITKARPDIIINCAAFTNVDKSEIKTQLVQEINVTGVKNICLVAKEINAVVVQISSDYVFDGEHSVPYVEEDACNPKSVYGKSKYDGEKIVSEILERYFIVRTAWLYGEGNNFVRTMLRLAEAGKKISVVKDQYGTPTSAVEVAEVIAQLVQSDRYGIYHATCEGSCSWYEFALEIFRLSAVKALVVPVTTKEYPSVVDRPRYSVLDNKNLRKNFNYRMPSWKEAIKAYLRKEKHVSMSKRVLVTGANGYIGRHVVEKLLDLGHEVIASDFVTEGIDTRAIINNTPIFSDDDHLFEKLGSPDVCIHMAWRNGFVHNATSHIEDLPNHYTFLRKMVEAGIKSFSVMGSMHEIGYWEGAIDENTPANPISLYGISKNALRQMCQLMVEGSNTQLKWLRAFYILGDDKRSSSIFAKIVGWEEEGKKTFPFNTGKNEYDFISVDTLAMQIAEASTQDEIYGIINCCTGKPKSLANQVEDFIADHEFKIRPEYGAFPDRPYDSPGIWGDSAKIDKIMQKRRES